LLSTDETIQSNRLTDHIDWIISKITPHQEELRLFIDSNSLHAVLSCFWHGPKGAKPPAMQQQTIAILAAISARLEQDFDTDADEPPSAVTMRLEVR
jgi:hypothetical protein